MNMSKFWIEKGIVDREDLDIYEKMLCIILARYYEEPQSYQLTNSFIAKKMGCGEKKIEDSVKKLKSKGLIISENKERTKIIKKESYNYDSDKNIERDDLLNELLYEDKIDKVYEIIDEKINDKEARIILNFAKNDLKFLKEKYNMVKKMQISDKIEALINELQKKENSLKENIEKKESKTSQINVARIDKLKMYNLYKK